MHGGVLVDSDESRGVIAVVRMWPSAIVRVGGCN
jgi:hypothetical protein